MPSTVQKASHKGLTLMEVMIALVILGLLSTAYLVTSHISQKNTGKSTDWQAEAIAIEKTVERLRSIHSVDSLRNMHSSWIDSTSNVRVRVSIDGATPSAAVCETYCDSLAQLNITARRDNFNDSVSITTYLFAKRP